MRVLILGATGMLGSAMFNVLTADRQHETWGTMRAAGDRRFFPVADAGRLIDGVNVSEQDSLVSVMKRVRPDVVINAVGVVKQLAAATNPLVVLPINSMLPHRLAALCGVSGARLIHVSTDCVFSGRAGGYTESDVADAEDLYGLSKYIGEVRDERHVITLRTSGIGHELNSRNGLVEWFLGEKGQVKGFSRAIYSGLPWVELARVVLRFVLPNEELHGLYHVASAPISKLDLLRLIADVYGKDIMIQSDDSVRIDRSLNSTRFREATGYVSAAWPQLVADMHAQQARAGAPHV